MWKFQHSLFLDKLPFPGIWKIMKNVILDQDQIICFKCDPVQIRSPNLKYDLDQDQVK